MTKINISDLGLNGSDLNGSDLFDDSESFLEDLSDRQLLEIHGGDSIVSQVTVSVGVLVARNQPTAVMADPLGIVLSADEFAGSIFPV